MLGRKSIKQFKLGVKNSAHGAARLGVKASNVASAVAPVAGFALGPEAGLLLEVGGYAGKGASKSLQKATK